MQKNEERIESIEKNTKNSYGMHFFLAIAVFVGLLIRYANRDVAGGDLDMFLIPWFDELKEMDFRTALTTQVGNYNMLYQFAIYLMTKFTDNALYAYKVFSVIFDISLACGAYKLVRALSHEKAAVLGFCITFLYPTVMLNSSRWGQCDSIYTSFIIWALYFLYTRKYSTSFVMLGLAFAFKLQMIFIIPFFGYVYLTQRKKKEISLLYFALIPVVHVVTALPNLVAGRPLKDIWGIYLNQTNTYHQMYLNYPSVWSLIYTEYDADSKRAIFITFIILLALFYWFYTSKAKVMEKHIIWCALILSYTCVLFLPAMHDRYGYLYEILAVVLAVSTGNCWIQMILTEWVGYCTYRYMMFGLPFDIKFMAAVNVLTYLSLLYCFYKELQGELAPLTLFERIKGQEEFLENDVKATQFVITQKDWKYMGILSLLFLLVVTYRIGSHKAPETFATLGTKEGYQKEIMLDLGANRSIDKICVYLGPKERQHVTVFAVEDGQWVNIADNHELCSVFEWSVIDVDETSYQFDMIFTDEESKIGEIVFVDTEGNLVLPKNGLDYGNLFDEQNCYVAPLNYYDDTMFDEIYHARSAYEHLHHLSIYEITHPPLGKTIIAIGIAIFGMNPFGWRIMCAIFGTLMIPIMYLFILRMTRKTQIATLASILLATEFMHFTLSRIATIDVIVAFFILCMFYGMYAFVQEEKARYLLFAGLASGLGVSTKWTACYALLGLAIIMFAWMFFRWRKEGITKDNRNKWFIHVAICAGCFVGIPAVFYTLSYIPYVNADPSRNLIQYVISNAKYMMWYHSNTMQEHPYASSWYMWLVDWVPVLDAYDAVGDSSSSIATFVNPFIAFVGLAAAMYQGYLAIWKKNVNAACLVIYYGVMLGPWIFITRTVFIYQYFTCTQALILMICNSIHELRFRQENKVLRLTAGISTALFILYFPIISGMMATRHYVDYFLKWFPRWSF